jgi:hypothetical protein
MGKNEPSRPKVRSKWLQQVEEFLNLGVRREAVSFKLRKVSSSFNSGNKELNSKVDAQKELSLLQQNLPR